MTATPLSPGPAATNWSRWVIAPAGLVAFGGSSLALLGHAGWLVVSRASPFESYAAWMAAVIVAGMLGVGVVWKHWLRGQFLLGAGVGALFGGIVCLTFTSALDIAAAQRARAAVDAMVSRVRDDPVLAAIATFDPSDGARLREVLVARARAGQLDANGLKAARGQAVAAYLPLAVARTSDPRLLRLVDVYVRSLDMIASTLPGDCTSFMANAAGSADEAAVTGRRDAKVLAAQVDAAMAEVFADAAGRAPGGYPDEAGLQRTYAAIEPRLVAKGLQLGYLQVGGGASPQQKCDTVREVFRLIPDLPREDGVPFARYLLAPR